MTLSLGPIADPLSAETAWSLRVRRVGGFIQAAFAGFWLVRGSMVLHGPASMVVPVLAALAVVGAFVFGAPAPAQQITGTPGSPSATTTINGRQLPSLGQ